MAATSRFIGWEAAARSAGCPGNRCEHGVASPPATRQGQCRVWRAHQNWKARKFPPALADADATPIFLPISTLRSDTEHIITVLAAKLLDACLGQLRVRRSRLFPNHVVVIDNRGFVVFRPVVPLRNVDQVSGLGASDGREIVSRLRRLFAAGYCRRKSSKVSLARTSAERYWELDVKPSCM